MDRSLFIAGPDARQILISNEAAKLTATYVNGIAIAVLAVGALAPAFAPSQSSAGLLEIRAILQIVCLVGSIVLHLNARSFLKRLR